MLEGAEVHPQSPGCLETRLRLPSVCCWCVYSAAVPPIRFIDSEISGISAVHCFSVAVQHTVSVGEVLYLNGRQVTSPTCLFRVTREDKVVCNCERQRVFPSETVILAAAIQQSERVTRNFTHERLTWKLCCRRLACCIPR